jgi:two-component system nitrogen regulation sensor histidine kinase GlnL
MRKREEFGEGEPAASPPAPSLERCLAVLDALGVGVLGVDGAGHAELQNSEASRILGLSSSVTLGRTLAEALGPRHPLTMLLDEVRKTERDLSSPGVVLRDRLGGSPLVVDLTASPVVGTAGNEGSVATLRDRTIGRQIEAFFDQRLRSELFANLAAGIAHEVRNPLAGIRGAAELLEKKLDAPLRRYPTLIRSEADRLRRLLDDLSELTQGGDVHVQPCNLHRILDDLVELSRQDPSWSRLEVVRQYDPSLPELEVDPDRITQVFLNLIRNAVHAMRGEGQLVLRTHLESRYHVSAEGEEVVRMVRVGVEDTGPGISEEDLKHVFTPFFTRQEGGSGLGLSIAQHWVVRHGGRIELGSELGRGTRVSVFLPVRRRR